MQTDSWGIVSLWGPKVRSPWVNTFIDHTELFFLTVKMQNVSCDGFRSRVSVRP